ncbi:transcriptional repressor [Psychromonas sp. SR45-3]|nr:transcriptional repressor [Psychromonas sp. SR45-3]
MPPIKPSPLLARAIDICKTNNVRFTAVRQQVFTLMAEHKGAITAYELLEQLQAFDSKAKPPTIYRALEFLLENNFIHRIESLNSYLMCCHLGCEHAMQLLICNKCKKVIELSDPVIDEAFSEKASQFGFKITNKVLEAHGICESCLYN